MAGFRTSELNQSRGSLVAGESLIGHAFGAAIRTREAWPSFQLTLEFRLPLIAEAAGQTRANGGIIIEKYEFFEVQILDR